MTTYSKPDGMSSVYPPALRPGSTIAVVAPASPMPRKELYAGLAWLQLRYQLRMRSGVLTSSGYLAGDDSRRTAELEWALTAPGIDAVFAARGGYGTMRVLERIDLARARTSPRWIVGFSDVTALHVCCSALGIASLHASNVTGIGAARPSERAALLRALERPQAKTGWDGLRSVVSGRARGAIFGGNLALLAAMAAGNRLEVPPGAILMLEDVTERPYRLDRMLTALALGGHLRRAGAIVLGGFDACDPGPDGITASAVLEERARSLGVPTVAGAPFGHGSRNEPFIIGRMATVDAGVSGSVVFE
jgi:muramoyltetrapeptide carboxypeptidase